MTAAGVKSQLKSAITSIQSKASEVSAGSFAQDVAADKASQSQSIVRIKESVTSAREKDLDNILEKLSPPPTKDIDTGGKNGGTKTVVDKEEVARLEGQKNNIQGQLEQARSDVETARSEAATDATAALEKAGVTKEKQSEMGSLLSQIQSINDSLSEGGTVSENQVKEITDKFASISADLGKADNVSGAITKAFYNPVKTGLEKMLKYVEKPATPRDTNPQPAPPAGTVDADLAAVGITGQKSDDIIGFMERVANVGKGIEAGGSYTEAQMQTLLDDHTALTSGLTEAQQTSAPLTELKTSVFSVIRASGHGDAVLPTAGANTGG